MRIDKLMVERGLAPTRERAKTMIMAGMVFSNGKRVEKAGTQAGLDVHLEVKGEKYPFVSRGGEKLRGALEEFEIAVDGLTALDVGASTGGFCDCLLQHGCKKVIALDVGHGQLDWKLRNDERVTAMERTNARFLGETGLDILVDLAVIDVSFISLTKIIPAVLSVVKPGCSILALIKPQFEVGKGEVGKGGVVRDTEKHRKVIEKIKNFVVTLGCIVNGVSPSVLPGPKGNLEFFILFTKKGE